MYCLSQKQLSLLPAHNIFHFKEDFAEQEINNNLRVIISKPVKAPFLFDSLVLSVAAKLGKNAAILVQASVKTGNEWSGFYKLFYISQGYKKTFAPQKDKCASINIDELKAKKPSSHFRYQITILGKADINFICAALTKAGGKYNESLALETLDLRDFILPFKPVIQNGIKDKKLSARICSPSAIAAVLNYYGKKVSLEETLKGVYDEQAQIYGVWPLNTAFAARYKLNSAVVRCSSLAQAEGEILQGRPLIVSVSYKKGGLKNAPVPETKGHLVTIIGFDACGNPVVADSAAKNTRSAILTYTRKEFAKAWLKNKKGLAYFVSLPYNK